MVRTDKERLDFLQKLTDEGEYTRTVAMRDSTLGLGWRLHETEWDGAVPDVRQAIDNYMNKAATEQRENAFREAVENSHMDEKYNHLNDELK